MKLVFDLLETAYTDEYSKECSDEKCLRMIAEEDECFIDVKTGDILCKSCGQCERYHRKKEAQRSNN